MTDQIIPPDAADIIVESLTPEELKEFIKELRRGIKKLERILSSWEYTAAVKSDKEFLAKLQEIEREIDNDDSPGVNWRDVLKEAK